MNSDPGLSKADTYGEIRVQLTGLFSGERNGLANAANLCALLYQMLPDVNWVGFYFLQDGELVLGPFQGKVACVRIPLGRGVCGTAAARKEILVVPDVNEFPGHIACDAASRSEIVVPLIKDGRLLGVLDVDSPHLARFDHDDRSGLAAAADVLLQASDFRRLAD
ncbi:MAG TPA: GAF domain-containing protein [Steroidobacteraceae bacterium]|nr:GAF domain-containing protein [Steroidobacteraceae bacterium]